MSEEQRYATAQAKEKAEMYRRKFLRFQDAELVYSIRRRKLMELAERAGAVYRFDGYVLLDREIFEAYLENFRVPAEEGDRA